MKSFFDLSNEQNILETLYLSGKAQESLFAQARKVRDNIFHGKAEARSVIEYSNICDRECRYCGMNRHSGVKRYILSDDGVLARVRRLYNSGRRVIMFQTGECPSDSFFDNLHNILSEIKSTFRDLTVICCLGNLSKEKYSALRDIGIERYILKFETSDPALYKKIKPSDSLKNRLRHLEMLKKAGFQVSSGNMVGLPGQTTESLVKDLLLLKDMDLPMGSTSVFIPNEMSPYKNMPPGDIDLALNFTAILRLLCPKMLIPSTSSLEMVKKAGVLSGLLAGANTVTLHDGTPKTDEERFLIYRKNRYIPTNDLFSTADKAGLQAVNRSLIRLDRQDSVYSLLAVKNGKTSTRPAYFCDEGVYTFRDLEDLTSRACSLFEKERIKEGETVLLALPDTIEFVVCFLACIRMGITAALGDPDASEKEWEQTIKETSPVRILTTYEASRSLDKNIALSLSGRNSSARFLARIKRYSPSRTHVCPDPNNPAIILFTSGTTGNPRGVVHKYSDLLVNTFPDTVLGLNSKDRVFSFSRLFTSFGLGNSLLFPLRTGTSVILSREVPNPFSFQKVLKKEPTLLFAVSSIYSLLADHHEELKKELSGIRIFVASGEHLSEETAAKWKQNYRRPILECFGSTEMCHPFISNIPGEERPGSCGKILPGFRVRFQKNGRMQYSGPSLFSRLCGETRLSHNILPGGWFRSEDMGYIDNDGYVHYKGRDNSIVKSGGRWISLGQIENILKRSSIIKDAAVSRINNTLIYYIILRPGIRQEKAERNIRDFAARNLRICELPSKVCIVNDLPRTRTGKINRRVLER